MKKLLFAAAIAALALTACSKKEAENTENAESVAATEEAVADATATGQEVAEVMECKDDTQFRPDKKVDRLTVLDFTATWCGPCQQLKPVFHEAAPMYPQAAFYSVDLDANPQTAEAFGVTAIPTVVILYPDGTKESYTGTNELLPADKLSAIITAAVNK